MQIAGKIRYFLKTKHFVILSDFEGQKESVKQQLLKHGVAKPDETICSFAVRDLDSNTLILGTDTIRNIMGYLTNQKYKIEEFSPIGAFDQSFDIASFNAQIKENKKKQGNILSNRMRKMYHKAISTQILQKKQSQKSNNADPLLKKQSQKSNAEAKIANKEITKKTEPSKQLNKMRNAPITNIQTKVFVKEKQKQFKQVPKTQQSKRLRLNSSSESQSFNQQKALNQFKIEEKIPSTMSSNSELPIQIQTQSIDEQRKDSKQDSQLDDDEMMQAIFAKKAQMEKQKKIQNQNMNQRVIKGKSDLNKTAAKEDALQKKYKVDTEIPVIKSQPNLFSFFGNKKKA